MFVDFKISHIIQGDNGSTNVLARIYLGDVTTEDELDIDAVTGDDERGYHSVTRYRRQELLDTVNLNFSEGATRAEIEAILRERLTTARADTLAIPEQRDA